MKGKIAVITGGGKGLGKELAKLFSAEGSTVVICSRSANDLKNVCNEIVGAGGKCEYFVVDVTSKQQVDKFIDKVLSSHGRIDVLVNNAGYATKWKGIEQNTEEEFETCFRTNVYSIFYFLKKIVPIMRGQNSGAIVNISSMAGKRGIPNLAAYCASKFAVVGLTQSVAKELKDTDALCISVCPGGMSTEMRAKIFGVEDAEKQQSPQYVANVIKDVLLGRIKVPNGGDIIIRYGEITAINPAPE